MNFVQSEVDILVYWMTERDRIRAAKEAGLPKPWTTDPLLRDFRWCNVRRMDDAVSQKLITEWYCLTADSTTDLTAAVLARLVNWPDSLRTATRYERFGLWHVERVRDRLADYSARGHKVFTGAYVVPGVPGFAKVDSVCNVVNEVRARAADIVAGSTRDTWRNLIKVDGLGSFLAGQVVADMAHLATGRQWPDRTSWAPIGPGSARGLNRLLGRRKEIAVSQQDFEPALQALMLELRPRVRALWGDRGLFAMDIQNCLCEFDKYRRLTLKEGTVRARYDGRGVDQSQQTLI